MESLPELSIRLVNVKQELSDEEETQDNIVKNVLSEHDYIVIKKEDNNNEELLGTDEEEEEELVDFDEDEEDKIQAARTLAELSIQPVTGVKDEKLTLPDLRRNTNVTTPGGGSSRFACNMCGKEYSTSSNLARHRQTHRSPDHSKARKCNLCNKVTITFEYLLQKYNPSVSGLCLDASLLHAHEDPRSWSQLYCLQQNLLQALAAQRSYEDPHRREAL